MYRIHSFEHDQIHIRDLERDLNAWTCALQLTPFFSHCPLKIAQRARHRFTLIFIEHYTEICQDVFNLESSLMQKELVHKSVWLNKRGIRSRKCISANTSIFRHFCVAKTTFKTVLVVTFPRKLCCGSNKWNQGTILRRRSQSESVDSRIFEMLDAKIASSLKTIIQTQTSRKSIWQSKRPKWKIDFSV